MQRSRTSGLTRHGFNLGVAAVIALTSPGQATGQERPSEPNPLGAVAGAVLGGTFGFFGGARIGAMGDCYEICDGIIYGALVGQVLGVPIGAHFGNGGRGNFAADLGISLASVGLGVAGASAASDANFYVVFMVAQVAAVAATEIKTSPDLTISAGPRIIGDQVGVGFTINW